ncbi:MAG: TPM domain-containing protein [Rudaea sp.]
MRSWLGLFAGVALLVAGARADTLLPIPALTTRVTDTTGTLDDSQKSSLEANLKSLEDRKGSQIAVLIVPTTQPEEIEQYSIRVVEAWKLGRKKVDDGVLLIVAKNDHHVRIEVGQGLEGAIPDAAAARIIREYITPKFRAGDFYGGIDDALGALTKLIDGEPLPPPLTKEDKQPFGMPLPSLLFLGIFGLLWLRGMVSWLPGPARAGAMGGIAAIVAWVATSILGLAIGFAVVAAIIGWFGGAGGWFARNGGTWGGGGGGWSSGGGGGGGGGFSGGGGGFSGGGASGSW